MSTTESCPLCGKTKGMRRENLLYGLGVCKGCRNGFANRRQFAFVIDQVFVFIMQVLVGFALGLLLGITGLATAANVRATQWLLIAFFLLLLFGKDGFSGFSPGKALMGVRVVDRKTGAPIGFGASVLRNLALLVPFSPLILGFQLIKGPRWGDGLAGTKVIWSRYADNPIFTGKPLEAQPAFAPINLPPVRETGNPFQAPRQ